MRKRKRRTSAGNNFGLAFRPLLALVLAVLLGSSLPLAYGARKDKDKGKAEPAYAVISGTVFRDSGLSLPGAEVTLTPEPQGGRKEKKRQALSDSRGEFAFRVPPGPMKYALSVKANGYQPQSKPVTIAGEERIDVFFTLEAASK